MKVKISLYCLVVGMISMTSLPAYATWEIGGKVGYDSNVNRTVGGAEGDTYLGGYLQYGREISGETRFDWTLSASLGGNVFFENDNLNNAFINFTPGIIYFPYLSYSINISPFVIGKVSTDKDQSAIAFGAKINLRQPFNKYFYMGEYYIYTDSRAQMVRDDGMAICSISSKDGGGYYQPAAGSEMIDYLRKMERRALCILKRNSQMKKISLPEYLGQLKLDMENKSNDQAA